MNGVSERNQTAWEHIQNCRDSDCEYCTELVEAGLVMGCDGDFCSSVGLCNTDSGSWRVMQDGSVLCVSCFEKTGEPDADGNF